MLLDRYSFEHSTASVVAVTAFEDVVAAIAAHRPAAAPLQNALNTDPHHVGAWAVRGLAAVVMCSEGSMRLSRDLTIKSQAALRVASNGGTNSERAVVDAHVLAAGGNLLAAAQRLEQHLQTAPNDLLAIKLAHALRFMSGDPAGMLATTSSVLQHWRGSAPGYGYLLGCHAFALEETGDFVNAELTGRAAVALIPDDVWGLHAVAHVMEMRGRIGDGIDWLQPTKALWSGCGNFGSHLAWHLALLQLSAGDHGSALQVFDTHLQTASTCDFRDVANATSLLWRLEQEGVDVGDRWRAVGSIASDRRQDTAYVFGTLHNLLALVGSHRLSAAHELVSALKTSAVSANTDQCQVSKIIGVDLAETILDMAEQRQSRVPLASLATRLPRLGGSVAQRDVFLRTLLLIAAESGDQVSTAKLKALRLRQRREDNFVRLVDRRGHTGQNLAQSIACA